MRLALKVREAVREGAFNRAAELARLADALEAEFPREIKEERGRWE